MCFRKSKSRHEQAKASKSKQTKPHDFCQLGFIGSRWLKRRLPRLLRLPRRHRWLRRRVVLPAPMGRAASATTASTTATTANATWVRAMTAMVAMAAMATWVVLPAPTGQLARTLLRPEAAMAATRGSSHGAMAAMATMAAMAAMAAMPELEQMETIVDIA